MSSLFKKSNCPSQDKVNRDSQKNHEDVEVVNFSYYGNKLIYNCEVIYIKHTEVIIETSLILLTFSCTAD